MAEQQLELQKQQMEQQAQQQQMPGEEVGGGGGDPSFDGLMVPQRGPKGGSWMVDPATGKKHHVDPSELWQKYERGEAEIYGIKPPQVKPPAPPTAVPPAPAAPALPKPAPPPIAASSGKGMASPVKPPKPITPSTTPGAVPPPGGSVAKPSAPIKPLAVDTPGQQQITPVDSQQMTVVKQPLPPTGPPEPVAPLPQQPTVRPEVQQGAANRPDESHLPKPPAVDPRTHLPSRQSALSKIFAGTEPKSGGRWTSYGTKIDERHNMQASLDHDAGDVELKFWRNDREFPVGVPIVPESDSPGLESRLDHHRLARSIHAKVLELARAGIPVRFTATPRQTQVFGKLLAGLGFQRGNSQSLGGKIMEKWMPPPQQQGQSQYARGPEEDDIPDDQLLTPEEIEILFGDDEPDQSPTEDTPENTQ
jgi:hypothetical protein